MHTNITQYLQESISRGDSLIIAYEKLHGAISKVEFYKGVHNAICAGEIPNLLECCCGYDCGKCKTFIATLNGDESLKQEMAAYYKSEFGLEVSLAQVHCLSGRSDEIMPLCGGCPFKRCSADRGIDSCNQCDEYPCTTLVDYQAKYVNEVNKKQ